MSEEREMQEIADRAALALSESDKRVREDARKLARQGLARLRVIVERKPRKSSPKHKPVIYPSRIDQ